MTAAYEHGALRVVGTGRCPKRPGQEKGCQTAYIIYPEEAAVIPAFFGDASFEEASKMGTVRNMITRTGGMLPGLPLDVVLS